MLAEPMQFLLFLEDLPDPRQDAKAAQVRRPPDERAGIYPAPAST